MPRNTLQYIKGTIHYNFYNLCNPYYDFSNYIIHIMANNDFFHLKY